MLFITAGMGGGTGTGAPGDRAHRQGNGHPDRGRGHQALRLGRRPRMPTPSRPGRAGANVDSLIVVLNDKLLEVLGDDITQDEAFAQANDVLKNAVGGIAEIINEYGLSTSTSRTCAP
jgi:cell division protein FtsZ